MSPARLRRSGLALLLLLGAAGPARSETWAEVFGAGRDTAVFLAGDGTLFRAPFDLSTREVLWRPAGGQHVVRFSTGAGGGIAWIVRGFDDDTTRLWLAGREGVRQRLRYFSLQPRRHGEAWFEPDVPTVSDHGARGGRLVRAAPTGLRRSANTLAWSADGRSIVLGSDGGIVGIVTGSRQGWLEPRTLPLQLDVQHPSGALLVDGLALDDPEERDRVTSWDLAHVLGSTLIVREGRVVAPPARASVLFAPSPGGWHACERGGWGEARVRAAGRGSSWWADGRVVRAVRHATCAESRELVAAEAITWLGYEAGRGDLLGASGRLLWRWPESGGPVSVVVRAGAEIRAVLPSLTSGSVAVVAGESLLVWSPASGAVRRFDARGLEPCALFEASDGSLVVRVGCGAGAVRMARADGRRGRLAPLDVPRVRGTQDLVAARGGDWLLLCGAAARPARRLHAYDVRAARWHEVDNPGIVAWEPLP